MKLTVLMPVYNAEKYIRRSIDSILKQTYTNFDFIIINDGSDDKSCEIIKGFAKLDNRIRLIDRENRGLIHTLNEGIQLAHSEYIARMDADDVSLPNRLSTQLNFLDNHPDVGCVGSSAYIIYDDGPAQNLNIWCPPTKHNDIVSNHKKGYGASMIHPSVMLRLPILKEIGGYTSWPIHAEDYELWCRLGKITQLANLNEPLLYYREHLDSVSFRYRNQQIEICQKIARTHYSGDEDYYPATKDEIKQTKISQIRHYIRVAEATQNHMEILRALILSIPICGFSVIKQRIRKRLKKSLGLTPDKAI